MFSMGKQVISDLVLLIFLHSSLVRVSFQSLVLRLEFPIRVRFEGLVLKFIFRIRVLY